MELPSRVGRRIHVMDCEPDFLGRGNQRMKSLFALIHPWPTGKGKAFWPHDG